MPSTVAVSIDFDHFANWNPQYFSVRTMPHAVVTVRTGVISTWSHLMGVYMSGMGFSQAQVDMLLSELYEQAQIKTTTEYLEIALQSNASPSGVHQSACPPTTGKEFAYALVNDPCNVIEFPYTSVQIS